MLRGKSTPLPNNNRDFILESITEKIRLDGRDTYDYRDIDIRIDNDNPGMVEVCLGGTRVLTRVTCEIVAPKSHRPREGVMFFQVELTPLASPIFDIGHKASQVGVEVCRLLERTIRDSRAVDLESLCIVAGEKVWEIKVYVNALDHCGNLIDCAAIATIAALKHFKRPDITICGQEITIHPTTERIPIPLTIYHLPLCVTFAFFHDGEYLLVDPTDKEEQVMDGRLIVGVNLHQEICALHLAGGVAILPDQIIRCFQIAVDKCKSLTSAIQDSLRAHSDGCGCVGSSLLNEVQHLQTPSAITNTSSTTHISTAQDKSPSTQLPKGNRMNIKQMDQHTAILHAADIDPWDPASSSSSNEEEDIQHDPSAQHGRENMLGTSATTSKDSLGQASDSEEDEVVVLIRPDSAALPNTSGSHNGVEPLITEGDAKDTAAAESRKRKKRKRGKKNS